MISETNFVSLVVLDHEKV